MDDVRGRIEHSIAGLQIEMLQLMEDVIGDLTAVPQPIEVKLFSDDGEALRPRRIQQQKRKPAVAGDEAEFHCVHLP